jgi:hypothetical protein
MISGWKTLLGGIGAILTGAATVFDAVTLEPLAVDPEKLKAGISLISGGFIAIGLGHKIDKSGIVNVK